LGNGLVHGVIAGLAASGLYSTGSTLKEGNAADKNQRTEGDSHETD
jgi:hypothetical protein